MSCKRLDIDLIVWHIGLIVGRGEEMTVLLESFGRFAYTNLIEYLAIKVRKRRFYTVAPFYFRISAKLSTI